MKTFENFMQEQFQEEVGGDDVDMLDAWLERIDIEDWFKYGDKFKREENK